MKILKEIDNVPDIVYHGTKSQSSRDLIIKEGFNSDSVFLSESKEDAEGYGRFIIAVYDVNSLNIKEIIPGKDSFDKNNYNKYDGIKYRYDDNHAYNYEIYNISKLNDLKRTKA